MKADFGGPCSGEKTSVPAEAAGTRLPLTIACVAHRSFLAGANQQEQKTGEARQGSNVNFGELHIQTSAWMSTRFLDIDISVSSQPLITLLHGVVYNGHEISFAALKPRRCEIVLRIHVDLV